MSSSSNCNIKQAVRSTYEAGQKMTIFWTRDQKVHAWKKVTSFVLQTPSKWTFAIQFWESSDPGPITVLFGPVHTLCWRSGHSRGRRRNPWWTCEFWDIVHSQSQNMSGLLHMSPHEDHHSPVPYQQSCTAERPCRWCLYLKKWK